VFRDGIEEALDLKVHIARRRYIDADPFHGNLCDVVIPKTEEFLEASGMVNELAVFLMDDCSMYSSPAVIELLSQHRVKAVAFPAHTYGLL
jgi:hypothetical protein